MPSKTHIDYCNWLHNEAVTAGMMMAVRTALRLSQFSNADAKRVRALLLRAGLACPSAGWRK